MFFRVTPQKIAKWQAKRDIKTLTKCLREEDPELKTLAVQALADIGDPASLKDIAALLRDIDPDIRYITAEAISPIAQHSILPELEAALVDDNWMVRLSVIRSLAKISSPRAISAIIQQVKMERDKSNVLMILELLKGKMGIKQVQEIYEFFQHHQRLTKNDQADTTILETLRTLIESAGAIAVPVLIEQAKSASKPEKIRLIHMIINSGGREAGKHLEPLIRDPDPDVQFEVLWFLSTCEAVTPSDGWFLVAILSPARTLDDRLQILKNLTTRKQVSTSIRPWVLYWLGDENPFAGVAVGAFRREFLLASKHLESEVRYRALIALDLTGDSMVLADLSERLLDNDERIRNLITNAVTNYLGDQNREFYDLWIGNSDPRLLRTPDNPIRRRLVKVLTDPVPLVRARAAYLLGQSEDHDLIPALRTVIEDHDQIVSICAHDAIQRMEPGLGVRNLLPTNLKLSEFRTKMQELAIPNGTHPQQRSASNPPSNLGPV